MCHVSRVSIRDKDNGIHPLLRALTLLSHNISNPLPPGVRDPEIWMLSAEKMNEQHLHGLTTQEDKNMSSDAVRKISGGKPHSIEFCFPVN